MPRRDHILITILLKVALELLLDVLEVLLEVLDLALVRDPVFLLVFSGFRVCVSRDCFS